MVGKYRDLSDASVAEQTLDPDTVTTSATGGGVDRWDGNGENVMFVVAVGESGDTLSGTVYFLLELEHSDDGSTWTDCADADLSTSITGTNTGTFAKIDAAAEDDAAYKTSYVGNKPHVRCIVNAVGTHSNGTPIGVVAIRTGLQNL